MGRFALEAGYPLVGTGVTFTSSIPGSYDSMDEVAVVMGINQEEQTITLRNMDLQRNYTLDYSQATRLEDRYGSSLSIAQIREGDLVQVTFLKNKKRLNTLFMCGGAAWTYEGICRQSQHQSPYSGDRLL